MPALGRLTLLCLKHSRSGTAFVAKLHECTDLAREALSQHGPAALEPVLSYIHLAAQLEPEHIADWAATVGPEVEELYVTSAEILEQRGLQKGLEQGRTMGIVLVLEKQLQHRFGPLDEAALDRLRSADAAQLEQWAERVLDARSLDELFRP